MKNKKSFQRWMLSAAALLMVIPLASQSQNVQARETSKGRPNEPGMIESYGIAPNTDPKQIKAKGKGGTSSSAIGVDLRSTHNHVEGTANANYIHDHKLDGYLMRNSNIKGKPFGPTRNKLKVSKEYYDDKNKKYVNWVVYTNPDPSEAGKVGMYYENALTYYPNTRLKKNKGKKEVQVDAYLIWNGTYRPQGHGAVNNIQFSTSNMSIKEPWQGAVNVTLKLYNHKTGQPLSVKTQIMQTDIDHKQGLLFDKPKYLIYDKDTHLDKGDTSVGWNTYVAGKTAVFGDNAEKNLPNHNGTVYPSQKEGQISYIPKNRTNSFNVTFVHSYSNVPYRYQQDAKFAKPASVKSLKKHKLSSLDHLPHNYDRNVNGRYQTIQGKVSGGRADYFGFEFDKGSNIPYTPPVDKLVSTKPNHFKKTKKSKNAISVKDSQPVYFDIHTQLAEPSSAYVKKDNSDDSYNALPLKTALTDKNDPNLGKPGLTKGTKSQQGLVLRDYIDSNFEVESAKIYAAEWGDSTLSNSNKAKDAAKEKIFYKPYIATVKKGPNKGKTVVEAVMRPEAAKVTSKKTWLKDYHLVIKVKIKKNVQPTHGTYAKGWYLLDNKGYLNITPTPDSWAKITFDHGSKETTGKDGEDGEPNVNAKKSVFAAKLSDSNKLGSALNYGTTDANAKLTGDSVYPDQYLYYRLKFTIKSMKAYQKTVAKDGKVELDHDVNGHTAGNSGSKGEPLIEDKFKNLTITDDLSDRFRNKSESDSTRDIDHVQVVMDDEDKLKDPTQNHKFSIQDGHLKINLTKSSDSDILDALSKSDKDHYIYVQYRVRIRPNDLNGHKAKQDLNIDPTDDQYNDAHRVENQAKIEGTFDEHQRYIEHGTYEDWDGTYYEDSDGNKRENKRSFDTEYISDWDNITTKHLSEIKKLTNKTTTNKTINWINVNNGGGIQKVLISWANTNDVINNTDKVWKVQANVPTMRHEGNALKTLTLKDTVKSNEKLDKNQTWAADNSDDSDLATGTYTGPQVFRNGENVTDKFDITSSSTTVIAKAKASYLKDLAENDPDTPNQFTLAVPGTIVENRKLNASGTFDALTGAQDESDLELEKQDDKDGDRQKVEADWEGTPDGTANDTETTIQKSIKAVKDLTTGKDVNVTGDGQYMNPKHKYEVTYQLDAQLGTDRDNRNLKISDALPENSSLVEGSLSVPKGFSTDGTTSTDIHIAYNGNANVLAAKGTMDNPTVETMT